MLCARLIQVHGTSQIFLIIYLDALLFFVRYFRVPTPHNPHHVATRLENLDEDKVGRLGLYSCCALSRRPTNATG